MDLVLPLFDYTDIGHLGSFTLYTIDFHIASLAA